MFAAGIAPSFLFFHFEQQKHFRFLLFKRTGFCRIARGEENLSQQVRNYEDSCRVRARNAIPVHLLLFDMATREISVRKYSMRNTNSQFLLSRTDDAFHARKNLKGLTFSLK